MKNFKQSLTTLSLGALSIAGSLFLFNKFKKEPVPKSVPAFFAEPAPYIFAHRGGMAERPEQTKLAFDHAAELGLDGFETDVRLTKDHQLVVFHDDMVDRTTNGSGFVYEHTLDELKRLDAGYYFKDINGNTPYRDHEDAKILSFEQLLIFYPNQLINVDIKDHPDTEAGKIAPKVMYETIKDHYAQNRVLVTSYHKENIAAFNRYSNGDVALGASEQEVAEGFIKFMLGLGKSFETTENTFQMPTSFKGIKLTWPKFIQWLLESNIVPGFYGINSFDEMKDLADLGVHTLVTDYPELGPRFKNHH